MALHGADRTAVDVRGARTSTPPSNPAPAVIAGAGEPAAADRLRHGPDPHERDEQRQPGETRQSLTERAAASFASVAQALRERGHDRQAVAHFVNRLVFCMFAADVGLLPGDMFTRMLRHAAAAGERAADRPCVEPAGVEAVGPRGGGSAPRSAAGDEPTGARWSAPDVGTRRPLKEEVRRATPLRAPGPGACVAASTGRPGPSRRTPASAVRRSAPWWSTSRAVRARPVEVQRLAQRVRRAPGAVGRQVVIL